MHAWICRILSFVFLLNVLFPVPSVAQNVPTNRTVSKRQPIKLPFRKDFYNQKAEMYEGTSELQGYISRYKAHLANISSLPANPYRTGELADMIVVKHVEVEKQYYEQEVPRRLEIEKREYREELGYQNGEFFRQDNTRVASAERLRRDIRNAQYYNTDLNSGRKVGSVSADRFLELLEEDAFTLEGLIGWLDPYRADELYDDRIIAYAGEVLGNTLDQVLQENNAEAKEVILSLLPEAQQRILYRIDRIKHTTNGVSGRSMELNAALGALRITAVRINNFYKKVNKKDPLMAIAATLPPAQNIYQKYMDEFLAEMRQLKSLDLEEGSAEQQKAVIWVDYAITYALAYKKTDAVKKIVQIWDPGASQDEFNHETSTILNSLFTSIFENIMATQIGKEAGIDVMSLFKEFSDPNKYSIPTRVFILEVASNFSKALGRPTCSTDGLKMNSPFKTSTSPLVNFKKDPPMFLSDLVNFKKDPPMCLSDRELLAGRVGDIYCPITLSYVVGPRRGEPGEDYGFDKADELKAFADKLGWIFDGFIELPRGHDYTLDSKGVSHKNYYEYTYYRNGTAYSCSISTDNALNKKMVEDENMKFFFSVVGEALLWVYGGEILSLGFRFIGTAYRSVKGVALASPKIIKAAVKARSGRKITAAVVEGKKAVRYANAAKNMEKAGAELVVKSTPTRALAEGSAITTAGEVSSTTFVARNMSQLRTGQRRWWQRLGSNMSGNQGAMIEEVRVVQQIPGFTYNVGTASVGGTRLAGGIRNYDDWRYLQRLFRTPTEGGGSIPFKLIDLSKPWNPAGIGLTSTQRLLTGKELVRMETELLLSTQRAVGNGSFDLWFVSNPTKGIVNSRTIWPHYNQWLQNPTVAYNISAAGEHIGSLPWTTGKNFFIAPHSNTFAIDFANALRQRQIRFGGQVAVPWAPTTGEELVSLVKTVTTKPGQWNMPAMNLLKSLPKNTRSLVRSGSLGARGLSTVDETLWLRSFTNHLSTTGQLDLLAGNLIQSTKFWQGFTGNLKFFGAWTAMDLAVYPFMNKWVENKAAAQYDELLAPYKDTFEQVKQDQREQNNGAEPVPAPLGIYDAVNAAQKGDFRGALISFPMLGILHSKPGQFLFGERSFVADKDKVLYPHLAAKLDLSHALYNREKTKLAKQTIEQIEAEKAAQVEQAIAAGGAAAGQEMQAAYDAYIAKASTLQDENIPAWKWNEKLKEERQALDRLILLNTIKSLEQQREQDLQLLSLYGEEWVVKGKAVYDSYINGIKGLTEGDLSSDGTSEKLGRLVNQFTQQMNEITEGLKSSSSVMESYYTEEMFDMVSYIQSLEDEKHMAVAMYSAEDGAKLMGIYDDAIRKMEDLANSSGLSQQNKMEKQNEIMSEWSEKIGIFQQEHRPDEMRVFDVNTKMQLSYVPEADKAKYQALIDAYRPHLAVIVSDSSLSEEDRSAKVSQFWEEFANEWSNVSAGVAQPEEVPAEQ